MVAVFEWEALFALSQQWALREFLRFAMYRTHNRLNDIRNVNVVGLCPTRGFLV